jgi:hypothetical protein
MRYLALVVAVGVLCGSAWAKAPSTADNLDDRLVTFDEVLDEIRRAVESGDWKTAGWKPHITVSYLDYLLKEVKQTTKKENLKLPITFDQVKPAADQQGIAGQASGLYVVKDGQFSILRQSIVLADGSVDISMAEGCIIIARGAVTMSTSQKNIVLAGQFAGINYDRSTNNVARAALPVAIDARVQPGGVAPAAPAAPQPAETVSLLMSAGILDVSTAYGPICCGLERLVVSYADASTVFLNSPQREFNSSNKVEVLDAPQVPFQRRQVKNPLEGKVNITQIVSGTSGMVVFQRGGMEYVLRPGSAIFDEGGKVVPGLENWTLGFLGRNYALFANGRQYAGFFVKR